MRTTRLGRRAQAGPPTTPPGDATSPLVHARELSVGYGAGPVCAPVDLDLTPGEVLALVGPNGAGKSTVLRAVLGLLEPLGGTLEVLGATPDERAASFRARVAGVMDDDSWFPALTTREHLLVTAAGHGVTSPGAVVDDVLGTVGLVDRADVLPSALSSGQRRRLLLAAAFVRPCDLLVLDEPEQRLDTEMRGTLADLVLARATQGAGVLVATHDGTLLQALSGDAVVIGERTCERMGAAAALARMEGGV
ncbi:ABC transporter ATP-binding protein [Cellulomonas bogoriensis]|uniref:ABC transporter n=1 Tax=Cellulomonas bogoriensis 69B4 = DSM 16987 TaxID=1386082 RepID=A0A0A0BPQ4_9CELL|nr:ABC transporter ATP-binding protein [Cellulomonas bogoriensis]KGM09637.1 ABC transporter [Cellulomonas bogoriensis 69B4 = DSM 16987]